MTPTPKVAYPFPMGDAVSEFAARAPHPRLRPFVTEYTGYNMRGFSPGVHAGLPSKNLTFIVAFDEPLDVSVGGRPEGERDVYWGLLAGLHSSPALIRHSGNQHGVQLAITPRGASALFGIPASELASESVHLDQVVPSFADELIQRLSEAQSWRARWAILDEVLLRVVVLDDGLPPELERAWAAMLATSGLVPIEDVARDIGWSRRHFSERFRQSYGLSPKVMARVLRFERAQKLLRLPTAPSLASIAAVCGYSDQAHMTREWNAFAGASPTAWLRDEQLPPSPDAGVDADVDAEDPPFLQASGHEDG